MTAALERTQVPADLAALDTDALLTELRRLISEELLPAVRRLALVWAELERRGGDLSDLKSGICRWLPRIAAGTLLPEAAVKYGARPSLLSLVAGLPPREQLALVECGRVKLVVPADGGGYTHRMMPPETLTPTQQRQVFSPEGALRDEREQIAVLDDRRSRPAARPDAPLRGSARADRKAGVVRVGGRAASPRTCYWPSRTCGASRARRSRGGTRRSSCP